jgi:hypothetical protein
MNDTTRSFSRSMEQAFGPGHRGGIYTPPEPLHPHDRIVLRACAVAIVALMVALVFWGGA